MSGLNLGQLKHLVVAPACAAIGLDSPAAINLVAGTALAESAGTYLHQLGSGPALGLWEVEPATAHDVFDRWLGLSDQAELRAKVLALLPAGADIEERLVTDLRFAAVMCRLRYRMAEPPLPAADDAAGLAGYHKSVYNTAGGAANVAHNTPLFAQAIAA